MQASRSGWVFGLHHYDEHENAPLSASFYRPWLTFDEVAAPFEALAVAFETLLVAL